MSHYPSYGDFGKSTKEFFTKGFQAGAYKLNIKSGPSKNIKATILGYHYMDKLEATGEFSMELSCPLFPGYSSITKWTTGNLLKQEVIVKDKVYCGLTLGLEGQYNIDTSSISGKFKSIFKHPRFTVDGAVEGGDSSNPLVGASIVSGYENFAGGVQVELDGAEQTFTKTNASLAYVKGPYSFHSSLDNAEVLWAGLIYRHNPSLELGLCGTYKSQPEGYTILGTGIKYVMDCCTALKAKIETNTVDSCNIGLGFETKVRPNATITMSALIDGTKLNEGGHKVGMGFDLEC